MARTKQDKLSVLLFMLSGIALTLWAYLLGTLTVSTVPSSTLEDIHQEFNNITIYEDGSYTGKKLDGSVVSGCINNALCDNER